MKWEELKNNQELLDKMGAEIEEKIHAGQQIVDARIEVFKAHDIEFDEDAMRAEAVNNMTLDSEALKNVAGGQGDGSFFCAADYSCYIAAKHDETTSKSHACWDNFYCLWMDRCSFNDWTYSYNVCWQDDE